MNFSTAKLAAGVQVERIGSWMDYFYLKEVVITSSFIGVIAFKSQLAYSFANSEQEGI